MTTLLSIVVIASLSLFTLVLLLRRTTVEGFKAQFGQLVKIEAGKISTTRDQD